MHKDLANYYEGLEAGLDVRQARSFERLVVPSPPSDDAVHSWFHMKEAYHPGLVNAIYTLSGALDRDAVTLHDPFAGSGTTVAAALMSPRGPEAKATASEINPWLWLLSSSKARALSATRKERLAAATELEKRISQISRTVFRSTSDLPTLPALNNIKYFKRSTLNALAAMTNHFANDRSLSSTLYQVAIGASIEPCSKLRRDGRALRYYPNKDAADPYKEVIRRLERICLDLRHVSAQGSATVAHGSALHQNTWPEAGQTDIVCFSPPYPNNIDYTEVYKLEAWMLGLITSKEEFRAQRKRTLESHPSIVFGPRDYEAADLPLSEVSSELTKAIVSAIPADRYHRARERMVRGYIRDMQRVMHNTQRSLRPGGMAFCIVGNSRHGSGDGHLEIASDLIIAQLAQACGLSVDALHVARYLHRRGRGSFLRETVIEMRKP